MNTQPTSLARAISVTSDSIAALILLGYRFYQQGKLNDSQDIFEGIVLLDATNPYAYGILGSIQQQQGRYEKAIECFTIALMLHPADINSLTNRGECYLHQGMLAKAAEDLKKAVSLDADGKNPAANRARVLIAATKEALKLTAEA
jgi:tetratricopeptide (TPR) repeat protein